MAGTALAVAVSESKVQEHSRVAWSTGAVEVGDKAILQVAATSTPQCTRVLATRKCAIVVGGSTADYMCKPSRSDARERPQLQQNWCAPPAADIPARTMTQFVWLPR